MSILHCFLLPREEILAFKETSIIKFKQPTINRQLFTQWTSFVLPILLVIGKLSLFMHEEQFKGDRIVAHARLSEHAPLFKYMCTEVNHNIYIYIYISNGLQCALTAITIVALCTYSSFSTVASLLTTC